MKIQIMPGGNPCAVLTTESSSDLVLLGRLSVKLKGSRIREADCNGCMREMQVDIGELLKLAAE